MRANGIYLVAAFASLFACPLHAQTFSGVGVNSDAGIEGNLVLDAPVESSKAPTIMLRLVIVEFETRADLGGEQPLRPAELLEGDAQQIQDPKRFPGGAIQVMSAAEAAQWLNVLRLTGRGRFLAEPTLITLSGRRAECQIGGEIPILQKTKSVGAKIENHPVGLRIVATPTYAEGRFRVALQIESNNIAGFTDAEKTLPIIQSRRVQTTVEAREGQAVGVGGLSHATDSPERKATTWLAIVTPSLVAPPKPVATPTPATLDDLHQEVQSLRRDVQRLLELLERQLQAGATTAQP